MKGEIAIPKQIRIGSVDYNIKLMDDEWADIGEVRGRMSTHDEYIEIHKNVCQPEAVLIHEMLHAIDHQCKLELNEKQIEVIEIHLTRALQDMGLLNKLNLEE